MGGDGNNTSGNLNGGQLLLPKINSTPPSVSGLEYPQQT